jgi:hypothetical protein
VRLDEREMLCGWSAAWDRRMRNFDCAEKRRFSGQQRMTTTRTAENLSPAFSPSLVDSHSTILKKTKKDVRELSCTDETRIRIGGQTVRLVRDAIWQWAREKDCNLAALGTSSAALASQAHPSAPARSHAAGGLSRNTSASSAASTSAHAFKDSNVDRKCCNCYSYPSNTSTRAREFNWQLILAAA